MRWPWRRSPDPSEGELLASEGELLASALNGLSSVIRSGTRVEHHHVITREPLPAPRSAILLFTNQLDGREYRTHVQLDVRRRYHVSLVGPIQFPQLGLDGLWDLQIELDR